MDVQKPLGLELRRRSCFKAYSQGKATAGELSMWPSRQDREEIATWLEACVHGTKHVAHA